MNKWVVFHFLAEEDLLKILHLKWVKGKVFPWLKRWFVGFSPSKEFIPRSLRWLKMLGFPLELWLKEVFEVVGNSLGSFIFRRGLTSASR